MTRTIGEAIEGQLHEMRIQQKELAAVIDVPVSTLNSWLRLGRDIPAQYILKIAHVLRCTPTYLLSGGEEDHEPLTRSDAIEDLIRATVAEVLRQQEAQKRRGDTEPQMRTAAYIERQREQLEQIRAEQAAGHGDPIRAMFYRMGAELLGDEITPPTEGKVIVEEYTEADSAAALEEVRKRMERDPSVDPIRCLGDAFADQMHQKRRARLLRCTRAASR